MTEDKGILIKNIYYMLSYAFKTLKQNNFESIESEDFDNVYELLAEILTRAVSYQLKQGLHREYITKSDSLKTLKGKINLNETIRNLSLNKQMLNCEFDELSENCIFNQIVKKTILILINCKEIINTKKLDLRKKLKNLLLYFGNVDCIELNQIKWGSLRFDRNSNNYQMIIYICYFIIKSYILSTQTGNFKINHFSDLQLNQLYEKFILEYYRKHHPELSPQSSYIDWNINKDTSDLSIIPSMKSDVTLTLFNGKKLIIDAKYYSKTMIEHFGKNQIHTNNLYQIFAYVTNQSATQKCIVDGILLYAKTQESVTPDNQMSINTGNTIYFKTLDLNQDFKCIEKQLEELITKKQ